MIWTVIVRATCDAYGHVVGVVVSHDKHVGTSFRCTIWAMRAQRRSFHEVTGIS